MFNDAGRPDARRSDRQAFLEAAAHMFFHLPRTFDETELRPLLMRICDPNGSGLSRTIGGMEFTPDAYLGLMRARLRALDALGRTHVDESLFHWARYTNIVARAGYRSLLARMTTPATAGEVIALPGVEQTAVNACRDLVTMLGLGLGMPVAVTRSLEDPAVWEKENLRSIVRGEYAEGGVTVTVSVQSEEEPGKKTADR